MMGIHLTQVATTGCGLAYKGFIMENDVKELITQFDKVFNAIDSTSMRVEAVRRTLEKLVPGFREAYKLELDQMTYSNDLASVQSPASPTEAQQIARLIVDLRSGS